MKIAIMQPYFLPYIGYFQLMAASDRFILFDDVHFITRGWINRNRILLNDSDHLFTIPLIGASQNRLINCIDLCSTTRWREKLQKKIVQSYCTAPWFEQVLPLINDIIFFPTTNLACYLEHALRAIHRFLGMRCKLIASSTCYHNTGLKGQERILDICRQEQATDYLNLPGGRDLYDVSAFFERHVRLKFSQLQARPYTQFGKAFVPNLSIIDVLMFNGKDTTNDMLTESTLQ